MSIKQKKESTEKEMKKILKELDVMVVIPMHEEKNYAQESISTSNIGSLYTIDYGGIQCSGALKYGIADFANPDKDLLDKKVRKYAMNSVCMMLKLLLGNKEFERIVLGKKRKKKLSSWFKPKCFLPWKKKSSKLHQVVKWVEKNSHKLALLVGMVGIVLT
ncbi:MAG: hypothetical protein ACREBA_10460, partial [Nitrosotalea sp.]